MTTGATTQTDEIVAEPAVPIGPEPAARTHRGLARCGWILGSVWDFFFGTAFLVVGLAALAAIPLLQVASLGYLLEVCGRVARTGRIRDGFVGVRKAARLGSATLGTLVTLSPLILIKHLGYIANLVNEGGGSANALRISFVILAVVLSLHAVIGLFAGGRLRHFLWPVWLPLIPLIALVARKPMREWFPPATFWSSLKRGTLYSQARNSFWDVLVGLRLPYYFWLGLRGFVAGVIWLFLPVAMLVFAVEHPAGAGPLVGFLGALLFVVELLYLPFLQTQFAAERRWKAMFELRNIRSLFTRAPIAFFIALLVTLALAAPLYLLKIEATPQEIAWLPALFFVAFTFPARLTTGWAVGRARRREGPRHWIVRWVSWLLMLPVASMYVLLVFFTQYSSWHGTWSLLEQHAFLLPVPFLGGS